MTKQIVQQAAEVIELFEQNVHHENAKNPDRHGISELFGESVASLPKNNSNECTFTPNNLPNHPCARGVRANNRGRLAFNGPPSDEQILYWREQYSQGGISPYMIASTMQRVILKPEWNSWKDMKDRCKKGYGVVHPDFEIFEEFLSIRGLVPGLGFTLDRIDPHNPEYSPSNTRWASKKLQTANRRNTVLLTDLTGECHSQADWARIKNVSPSTIRSRLRRPNWTEHDAIHGRPRSKTAPKPRTKAEKLTEKLAEWRVLDSQLSQQELIEKAYSDHEQGHFNIVRFWVSLYRATYDQEYELPDQYQPRVRTSYLEELYQEGGIYIIHLLTCVLTDWETFLQDATLESAPPTTPEAHLVVGQHSMINSIVRWNW